MVCALVLTVLFAGCLGQSRSLLDVLSRLPATLDTSSTGLPGASGDAGLRVRANRRSAIVGLGIVLLHATRRRRAAAPPVPASFRG